MMGLAIAVAAVLAERWPSAGAAGLTAGVSADFVADVGAGVDADVGAGIGAGQGGRPRRCHGRPGMARWHLGRLARAQQPWLRRRSQVRD